MRVLSMWQPWASLCFLPQPVPPGGDVSDAVSFDYQTATASRRPIKTIETRPQPCPPSIVGQTVAIHATLTKPGTDDVNWEYIGDDCDGFYVGEFAVSWPRRRSEYPPRIYRPDGVAHPLPLGCILGTVRITGSVPIHGAAVFGSNSILRRGDRLYLDTYPEGSNGSKTTAEASDQLPFGDFRPGRFGWLLEDARPLREPLPFKGGQGWSKSVDDQLIKERTS